VEGPRIRCLTTGVLLRASAGDSYAPLDGIYDAKYFGIKMPPEVPMKLQERAYTSPIWYTPLATPLQSELQRLQFLEFDVFDGYATAQAS
jgi:hypothetical protein